jgi:hypothetical protein
MTPVNKKMKLPPIVFLGLGLLSLWGLPKLAAHLLDRLSTPALVQVQPTTTGYDFLPTNP